MWGWFGGGGDNRVQAATSSRSMETRSTKRRERYYTEEDDDVELQERGKSSKGGGWFGWLTGGGKKTETDDADSFERGEPSTPSPRNRNDAARALRNWIPGARAADSEVRSVETDQPSNDAPDLGLGNLTELAGNAANGGLEANAICPTLTVKQRVLGFLACMAAGGVISLLSGFSLLRSVTGGAADVAFMFTLANVVSLMGTAFLVSPKTQCDKMIHPDRRKWSALYIGAIILTFVVSQNAEFTGSTFVLLGLVVVQYLALLWYTLSYIPFGQTLFQGIISNLCKKEESPSST